MTTPARRPIWRAILLALVLVVGVGVAVAYLLPPRPDAGPAASDSPSPSPTPTIPEIARQQVWTSDVASSGEFRTSTATTTSATSHARMVDYVVKVETTLDVDADAAVAEVQAVFDDPRGWSAYGRTSFRAVVEAGEGTLLITIAAPDTAQELCAPLDIERKWNCRVGDTVVINSDRWLYMTPTYDDLGEYRAYLVNHEVGHFLGLGHVGCQAEGAKAPVMMQQSIELDGCVPNAWPREAD